MSTNPSTALITGGTSGIGRSVANKLAALGIHIIVVGRSAERGQKTFAEIRVAGGRADFISSDLRDASSAREVTKAISMPRKRELPSPNRWHDKIRRMYGRRDLSIADMVGY